MNVIEVKNVSICYNNRYKSTLAVENVSFNVPEGDYFCIVGDNGSGKSSLVKAIVGINSVMSGRININVSKDEMSFLSQSSEIPSDFPATVKEVILCGTQMGKRFQPLYKKKDYDMATSAMKLLDILDIKNKRFGELSGGQRQRVLLSRSLCRNPKVLILDEPFSGLDVGTVSNLSRLLKYLNEKIDTTIVMVTHNYEDVEKYASHVLHLNKSVLFCGTKSEWTSKRKCGD